VPADLDRLNASVRELEQKVRDLEGQLRTLRSSQRKSRLGSIEAPMERLYLKDSQSGSVGWIDFNGATPDIRVTKVR
jgi:hypothetical protein